MREFAQPRVIESKDGHTMLLYRVNVKPGDRHKDFPIPPGCYVVVRLEGPEYCTRSMMGPHSEHMALHAVQTLSPRQVIDMMCVAMEKAQEAEDGVPEGMHVH